MSMPPDEHLGPYWRVIDLLGQGATCHVYEVRSGATQAAAKLLRPKLTSEPNRASAFERECDLMLELAHSRLVHAVGRDVTATGQPFLIMELLEGDTLEQILEANGALGPRWALHLVHQLAQVLGYLHRNELVHCDVTPENLVIDPGGQLKLIDLGLHYDLRAPRGRGQGRPTLGSPLYVAPELLGAPERAPTPAVDAFGLGMILLTCLLGQVPSSPDPAACEPLEREAPGLLALLEATLEPDPGARLVEADELCARIEAIARAMQVGQTARTTLHDPGCHHGLRARLDKFQSGQATLIITAPEAT